MAEALVQSGALVFFVTHFTDLGAYKSPEDRDTRLIIVQQRSWQTVQAS
jgi:hypothetical protein